MSRSTVRLVGFCIFASEFRRAAFLKTFGMDEDEPDEGPKLVRRRRSYPVLR